MYQQHNSNLIIYRFIIRLSGRELTSLSYLFDTFPGTARAVAILRVSYHNGTDKVTV